MKENFGDYFQHNRLDFTNIPFDFVLELLKVCHTNDATSFAITSLFRRSHHPAVTTLGSLHPLLSNIPRKRLPAIVQAFQKYTLQWSLIHKYGTPTRGFFRIYWKKIHARHVRRLCTWTSLWKLRIVAIQFSPFL